MAVTEEVITKYLADVSDFNAKFTEMENKHKAQEASVASLGKTTQDNLKKTGAEATSLGKKFDELGRRVAAAFTVTAIIAFSKASVAAFAEAELSVRKLNSALSANGGTQEQLKTLINQSKELQKITIFSDEQIQGAQTLALQFGLTATEVERLIPIIADFASATGQDLKSALEAVLRGSEGVARGLKVYGIEVDSNKTKSERLTQITDQLTKKFGGQAQEVGQTTTGAFQRLKNAFNDVEESIGSLLSKGGGVIDFLSEVTEGLARFFKSDKQVEEEFRFGITESAKKDAIKSLEELRAKLTAEGKDGNDAFRILINESNTIIAERQKALFITLDAEKRKNIQLNIEGEKARISAIESVLADENKIRERTAKEGAEDAAKAAEKAAEAREKAEKEVADKITEINEENFRLAEDNLKKFQAEQVILIENSGKTREEKELAFTQLELDILNVRRQNYIDYGKDIGDIDVQIANKQIEINKTKEKSAEETSKNLRKFIEDDVKAAIEAEEERLQKEEEAAERRKELIQEVHDLSQDLLQTIDGAFDAQTDSELERIEDSKDVRIQAIDDQIEALEEANDRGRLSDRELEKQKKVLLEQRTAAEKKALEERNKIKRAEAEREKQLSLFRIGLLLAEAIAEGPLGVFKAIAAGAQLAVVAATPIPEFWKGTKGKEKEGLGYVGERGKELLYMPGKSKVVPAPQTKKYEGMLDAMIDNRLEQYVFKNYTAPALLEANKKNEQKQSKSFAENIAAAFKMKSTEWDTYHALQNNNKAAAQAIGEVIAKKINTGYKNPRYH